MGAVHTHQPPQGAIPLRQVWGEVGSARDVDEAATVVARWVRASIDRDAFVAIFQPDSAARLRVVWRRGEGPEAGRRRSAARRAVFESQRATRVRLSDVPDRISAVFPLASAGHAIGVLEVVASDPAVDRAWETLKELSRHLGLRLDDLSRQARPKGTRARRRNEMLDLGIALTAHEIRGPLLGVRAVLELLLERPHTDPRDVEFLRCSVRELDQLAGSAEGLLAWAAGARRLQCRRADVVRVVDEAVRSCRLETREDRVVVFAPSSAPARIDPPQLHWAIVNLLRNALAYADQATKVEVTVREEGSVVLLSVRDEGPAIPAADRERIFDPFVRGSAGRRVGNPSGLGLFIARRVTEDHGGRIWVESDRSGTTFHLMLPVGERRGRRFAS